MAKDTQKTIYVANFKESEQFGKDLLKGAICIDKFLALIERDDVKELIYEYDGKRYVNIEVMARKNPDKFGNSYFAKIPTFVPNSGKQQASAQEDVANDNKKGNKQPAQARKKATAK